MRYGLLLAACFALATKAVAAPSTNVDERSSNRAGSRPSESVHPRRAAFMSCGDGTLPVLTVWTSRTCIRCQRFWRDFREDHEFRKAIQSRVRVNWLDHDAHWPYAATRGITTVPTFVMGHRRITGYEGREWLLRRLTGSTGEPAATPPSQTSPDAGTATPEPERTLSPLPPLTRERNTEATDESPPDNVGSDRTPASPIVDNTPTRPPPNSPHETSPHVSSSHRPGIGGMGEWISRSVPLALTGLQLVGILGGTAATGGLGTLALAAIWRLWKRRRQPQRIRSNTTGQPAQGEEADGAAARAPFPRRLDEARQLLALRQSEGRVATLDALRGMFLDDELTKLAASTNAAETALAHRLKATIDARVDEVAPLSTTIAP